MDKKTKTKQNKTLGFGRIPINVATCVSAIKAIWMIRSDVTMTPTLLHDPVALFDNKKCPFINTQPCSTKKHKWVSGKIYILLHHMLIGNGQKKQQKKKKKQKHKIFVCFCRVLAKTGFEVFLKKNKKKTILTNFCLCTHLGQMFKHCQHIQVNKGKLHYRQNIHTHTHKVSDAYGSQVIAQIATVGLTDGPRHKPQCNIK